MARMGVHPRFAHMALVGAGHGAPELAALLASMLSEKDVLRSNRGEGPRSADVRLRLEALANGGGGGHTNEFTTSTGRGNKRSEFIGQNPIKL